LNKIPDCNTAHHSTHTGTFAYIASITNQKVAAQQAAQQQAAAAQAAAAQAAAAQEREQMLQQIRTTQASLQSHKAQLVTLHQTIQNLNNNITALNTQREEDMQQVRNLNTQITDLQARLNDSTTDNQELVTQISVLHTLSITAQNQLSI
jgi:septal ring factor EnvC (AmiA/AmiB activator)